MKPTILPLALAVMLAAGVCEAQTNRHINAIVFEGDRVAAVYTGGESIAPFTPFTNQVMGDGVHGVYGTWVSNQFARLTNGATFCLPDGLNEYTKNCFINTRCWKKTSYRLAYSCDGNDHKYMSGSEKVWTYERK